MSSVVKVAILGTGPIAEHHIIRQKNHRSFIPVAIFGENEDRKQYLAKKYNLVATHSLEDCLVRDVDIVDISTVNNKHFDYALDALKHNKAVIVEKPAAFTTGEIDKLIAESKEKVNNMEELDWAKRSKETYIYNAENPNEKRCIWCKRESGRYPVCQRCPKVLSLYISIQRRENPHVIIRCDAMSLYHQFDPKEYVWMSAFLKLTVTPVLQLHPPPPVK